MILEITKMQWNYLWSLYFTTLCKIYTMRKRCFFWSVSWFIYDCAHTCAHSYSLQLCANKRAVLYLVLHEPHLPVRCLLSLCVIWEPHLNKSYIVVHLIYFEGRWWIGCLNRDDTQKARKGNGWVQSNMELQFHLLLFLLILNYILSTFVKYLIWKILQ